jgi:hypothetical protein
LQEWQKKLAAVKIRKEDMNALVMNFLVTEGYVEAARMFESESGTAPGVDLESITDRMQIRKAVQNGDEEDAIDRVNDLNPEILEEKHHLFFHLQQQRMIELIREGHTTQALEFAQEYLAPRGEENAAFLAELERTVALLAFEDARISPVGDLMDVAQRQKTASELNAAILQSQCQEQEPRLPSLLKMMLWAQDRLSQLADFPKIKDLSTGDLIESSS